MKITKTATFGKHVLNCRVKKLATVTGYFYTIAWPSYWGVDWKIGLEDETIVMDFKTKNGDYANRLRIEKNFKIKDKDTNLISWNEGKWHLNLIFSNHQERMDFKEFGEHYAS